ncbi:hypothetical protein Lal_00020854 [Lupinus albus]|nr:hypothetical protein Lal_00020854 [Lupinus albus]
MKEFVSKLFNERHDSLLSDRIYMKEEDQNYFFYGRIWEFEVKDALKRMENDKSVGQDNIPIEAYKILGEHGISRLTID